MNAKNFYLLVLILLMPLSAYAEYTSIHGDFGPSSINNGSIGVQYPGSLAGGQSITQFRVLVPPGATRISLQITVLNYSSLFAVAHLKTPPTNISVTLPYDPGTGNSFAKLEAENGYASTIGGGINIANDAWTTPLIVDRANWLYVDIVGGDTVFWIKYQVYFDKTAYDAWYNCMQWSQVEAGSIACSGNIYSCASGQYCPATNAIGPTTCTQQCQNYTTCQSGYFCNGTTLSNGGCTGTCNSSSSYSCASGQYCPATNAVGPTICTQQCQNYTTCQSGYFCNGTTLSNGGCTGTCTPHTSGSYTSIHGDFGPSSTNKGSIGVQYPGRLAGGQSITKFRAFIPPGAIRISLQVTVQGYAALYAAAHLKTPPENIPTTPPYDPGTGNSFAKLEAEDGYASTISGSINIANDAWNTPLSADHANWLYVDIVGGDAIYWIKYQVYFDKTAYDTWYSCISSWSQVEAGSISCIPTGPKNKSIIVAGGGDYTTNQLWQATWSNAICAYDALTNQGYSPDNIYFLSAGKDLPDQCKLKDYATKNNLEYLIRVWVNDATDLLIYMVDHGEVGSFLLSETEKLEAGELAGWLDNLQKTFQGNVIIVYDACYSGSFINILKGQKRTILTSASAKELALFATNDGIVSFSWFFWSQIKSGFSFCKAFINSKDSMSLISKQSSQIDVNGDGNPDSPKICDIKVGYGKVWGGEYAFPTIEKVSPPQTLTNGNSATIYADNVIALSGIRNVWAVITPPNYVSYSDTPVISLPTLELKSVGKNRYAVTYDQFIAKGTYKIAIFVTNNVDITSIPEQKHITSVIQTQGSSCVFVNNDLALNLCAEYIGKKYGCTLNSVPNQSDPKGWYWKMDVSTFRELSSDPGNCISVGSDLKLNLCAEYQGKNYGFTMNFYPNDPGGLYWKMDVSTFREIQ